MSLLKQIETNTDASCSANSLYIVHWLT